MTKENKEKLRELLITLELERMNFLKKAGHPVEEMSSQELYELDDGDRLLEGCDIILNAIAKK